MAVMALWIWATVSDEGPVLQASATHRVRRSQTAGLKAQPREEGVRLDNGLKRRRDRVALVGFDGLAAVLEEDLLALGADGRRHLRREPAAKVGAVTRGAGLEVGGEGIANAGREEAGGGLDDDGGVDEDGVRVLGVEAVGLEFAVRLVDDGEGGAGRVGGSSGGQDGDLEADVVGNGLGGVDGLAAAEGDNEVDRVGLGEGADAADLLSRGLAAEDTPSYFEAGALEGGGEVLAGCEV